MATESRNLGLAGGHSCSASRNKEDVKVLRTGGWYVESRRLQSKEKRSEGHRSAEACLVIR